MKKFKKCYNFITVVLLVLIILFVVKLFLAFLTQYDYFTIKNIEVRGANFVNKNTLDAYCNNFRFNNIFSLKFKEIDDFHNKWVKKVSFKKIYPDKVELYVYERKPLFRIKSGDNCYYLTDDLNRIESDCENINVIVEEPLSNHLLLGFAEIYKHFGRDFHHIKLFRTYFKAYKDNTELIGTYNNEFLTNYRAYSEKISQLYKNIERVDLRIGGKIYVKGALDGA